MLGGGHPPSSCRGCRPAPRCLPIRPTPPQYSRAIGGVIRPLCLVLGTPPLRRVRSGVSDFAAPGGCFDGMTLTAIWAANRCTVVASELVQGAAVLGGCCGQRRHINSYSGGPTRGEGAGRGGGCRRLGGWRRRCAGPMAPAHTLWAEGSVAVVLVWWRRRGGGYGVRRGCGRGDMGVGTRFSELPRVDDKPLV